ncbi:KAP family P-loop NTPase fold protein [Ferroacidibacillus organovorans]|uniref:ATPase n=1 Tax=Ferroacidibacillus organovorans TaxID=1765683 RepID=A0A853KCN1_9BACL|nr:P-loop NTPase fold protein [Ferroacidibacillus organovorans]KYP79951.1 ATPase [Ferroacidibacillus organovorans]OAG94573.1 ATPase [Ferroacidibacillus organovorans]
MWHDNETDRDFLNFTDVTDTVAEIIVQAQGRPISIGVSGAWGVGKSSMLKFIRQALERHGDRFVFVEFNAWLYQGYDDARAALLEVIANKLDEEAQSRQTALDEVKELLKRVNWLRVAKFAGGLAMSLGLGLPPVGLAGEIYQIGAKVLAGKADAQTIGQVNEVMYNTGEDIHGLLRPESNFSPPKEINAIRDYFQRTLAELAVKLVVLIDDLDRCLPPTTISTLEAIRLFLFMKDTAFVIAADDTMIKHAVRSHFANVNESAVVNYFDKLIQVPIRVPPLGTQEVRAYMMLLFIENSSIPDTDKEEIRTKVCNQLTETWKGKRVDRAFIESIYSNLPDELESRLDTAERLAPLMTTASQILGNPRLIKRFMNTLSIRMAMAKSRNISIDEAVLAKMLLFERCASPDAYNVLISSINNDNEGKARLLGDWERRALAGDELQLSQPWDDQFIREWLTITPRIADIDLRGVLYVSREHAPLITPEDQMSSEGVEVLAAILEHPDMAAEMQERLAHLPRRDLGIIMDRVLERSREVQEWGTPPILNACLALVTADPSQGARLAAFLRDRPPGQIKPSIVPKIGDQSWAPSVFSSWQSTNVSGPVKQAIEREVGTRGHL